MSSEAERAHGDQVQRRSWNAAAASAYATQKDFSASRVGALDHLGELASGESSLLSDFIELARVLPWTPTSRVADGGQNVALVDLFNCLEMDLGGAGVLLLGPGEAYPEHQHRPAEVYLILHGSRRWRFGGSDRYRLVEQGEVLSNGSMDIHGVQAGDDTLVALWVLMDDRY